MVNSLSDEATSDSTSTKKGNGGSRPSFTDYWRRTKEAAKQITFVSSNLEQQAGPSSKDDTSPHNKKQSQQDSSSSDSQAKSQARRAQVRKAQIQHRQRKANYTKQLEMDVAELRDLIARAERDGMLLKGENEAIRRKLLRAGVNVGVGAPRLVMPTLDYGRLGMEAGGGGYSPQYTVNFLSEGGLDLGTPVYQVQRTSTPSGSSAGTVGGSTGAAPGGSGGKADADYAINFILGLEHVCWDHFHPSYYDHDHYDPESSENGHALMATSLALRSAPAGVWEQIDAEKKRRNLPDDHTSIVASQPPIIPPLSFGGGDNSSYNNTNNNIDPNILASWQISPPPPLPSQTTTQSNPTPTTAAAASASGLTLEGLYGLASTLTPADGSELAPVQAWFEMLRLYSNSSALTDISTMDRVKSELASVVECVFFGAVIQRGAFEDVLERVLGPIPVDVRTSGDFFARVGEVGV
ncbi:uncharacterized protein F4822DRAFT_38373 [Hypoxylon trugodes]|uniref:uncharacterized protein n=1 Tax=Hypoxylon trugodes TaxID=326681 RepID=UPI0021922DFD|nr:uncharacterized protein F4822DRAFT_38373 [Hypoxylon trugodes]KAI1394140.1 hypothetical protein F4822DRAFT_38373 [Hypoxylon trugodes]